jgi:uncharacterized protein
MYMPGKYKEILMQGNAAIADGNHEAFLSHCTDDTEWIFVGEQTLKGKDAVRRYMEATYHEPPRVTVDTLIEDQNFLTAVGDITLKDKDGKENHYAYCDVWRFREGKMASLRAFVIKK